MEQRLRVVGRLRELVRLGLESVGGETSRRDRLESMNRFYSYLDEEVAAMIDRYREQGEKPGGES